jgi:hypothetical protein
MAFLATLVASGCSIVLLSGTGTLICFLGDFFSTFFF